MKTLHRKSSEEGRGLIFKITEGCPTLSGLGYRWMERVEDGWKGLPSEVKVDGCERSQEICCKMKNFCLEELLGYEHVCRNITKLGYLEMEKVKGEGWKIKHQH